MRTTLKIAGLSAGLAALLVAVVDLPQASATVPTGKAVHDRLPTDTVGTVRLTPLAPAIRVPSEDALREQIAARCAKAVWPAVPPECLAAGGTPARAVRTITIERRDPTVTSLHAPASRAQR